MTGLLISMAALADIDSNGDRGTPASAVEVSRNRSCFQELEQQGCRHPSEDMEHFRVCLSESFSSLTLGCRNMMSTLYGMPSPK